jgi:putative sporulation protein YyaC
MMDEIGRCMTTELQQPTYMAFLAEIASLYPDRERIAFVCIGSDRSAGDSFGPLLGTLLKEQGWPHVIGTLEQPCDAYTVEQALSLIPQEAVTIAIDACLGKPGSTKRFICARGPLQPGKATGLKLPPIGSYSIAAVVNENGPKAYMKLQTASLYGVMQMAAELADAIDAAWGVPRRPRLLPGQRLVEVR